MTTRRKVILLCVQIIAVARRLLVREEQSHCHFAE
jgi:hypothetical protein